MHCHCASRVLQCTLAGQHTDAVTTSAGSVQCIAGALSHFQPAPRHASHLTGEDRPVEGTRICSRGRPSVSILHHMKRQRLVGHQLLHPTLLLFCHNCVPSSLSQHVTAVCSRTRRWCGPDCDNHWHDRLSHFTLFEGCAACSDQVRL